MLGYCLVGTRDLAAGIRFYDALCAYLDMPFLFDNPRGGRVYGTPDRMFGVVVPFDREEARSGNGTMVGFVVESRAKVDGFHAKVLELGGSCEGPPGLRGPAEMNAYFAYARDPEGNKLCAYRFGPE